MAGLFPDNPLYPDGFAFIPDFITVSEEKQLLDAIAGLTLHNFLFQGFEAKRRVASFGFDYSFDSRKLKKGEPIPEAFMPLIHKVAKELKMDQADFVETLVTEYPPGAVINWHRDAPPFETIAGISLLTGCILRLRPYDKKKQDRKAVVSLPVGRRSLYVIKGLARDEWEHSIRPVNQTRYSVTLRTLRKQGGAK